MSDSVRVVSVGELVLNVLVALAESLLSFVALCVCIAIGVWLGIMVAQSRIDALLPCGGAGGIRLVGDEQ